jgi:hypothetical protein
LQLSDAPDQITINDRREAEEAIASNSFATAVGSNEVKDPGKYALTLEQLSA